MPDSAAAGPSQPPPKANGADQAGERPRVLKRVLCIFLGALLLAGLSSLRPFRDARPAPAEDDRWKVILEPQTPVRFGQEALLRASVASIGAAVGEELPEEITLTREDGGPPIVLVPSGAHWFTEFHVVPEMQDRLLFVAKGVGVANVSLSVNVLPSAPAKSAKRDDVFLDLECEPLPAPQEKGSWKTTAYLRLFDRAEYEGGRRVVMTLGEELTVELSAKQGQINPQTIKIRAGDFKPQEYPVYSTLSPDSNELAIATTFPTIRHSKPVKIACQEKPNLTFTGVASPPRAYADGNSPVTLQIKLVRVSDGASVPLPKGKVEVRLTGTLPGIKINPEKVTFNEGDAFQSATVTSTSLGEERITLHASDYDSKALVPIHFYFPWSSLVAALLGGILGGTTDLLLSLARGKAAPAWLARLLAGAAVGVLVWLLLFGGFSSDGMFGLSIRGITSWWGGFTVGGIVGLFTAEVVERLRKKLTKT